MPALAISTELRDATAEDEPFLLSVFTTTCEAEAILERYEAADRPAIAARLYDLEQQTIAAIHPHSATLVILVEGKPAGRLVVDVAPDVFRVLEITLLPSFRGRGIGTALLTGIITRAALRNTPVELRVSVDNRRAHRFYERLGFRVVAIDGSFLELRRVVAPSVVLAVDED